ncbi:hypothetical protein DES49_3078 [Halospina denitrificans]|uniref:DUF5666 domain-containing protein n=1 Tax=Halospina denitrificans TaxID=332522 RepID=A0A4R7JIJ5_9GAMM|nr:hypothetical protein [Halospina denitrificans]TDT37126.1 hypothetical protein DES49_3078 [Halospina denitrificans]
MKATNQKRRHYGAGILVTALIAMLLAVSASAADVKTPGAEESVMGPIQAVEESGGSLIVEGRRFFLAQDVLFDGVEMARDQVLERLSKGDSVILYRESISQERIEQIRTSLR